MGRKTQTPLIQTVSTIPSSRYAPPDRMLRSCISFASPTGVHGSPFLPLSLVSRLCTQIHRVIGELTANDNGGERRKKENDVAGFV